MLEPDLPGLGELSRSRSDAEEAYPLLARLQMVSAACAESMSLDDLGSVALGQGVGAIGAAGAVLYLCRHDGLSLAGSLRMGRSSDGWELIPYDETLPITDALRRRSAVWLPSVLVKQQLYPALAAIGSGFGATASLPLVADDRELGVLGVAFTGEHSFSAAERLFLLALSDQIAGALARIADGITVGPPGARRVCIPLSDPGRLAAVQRLRYSVGNVRAGLDRFARLAAGVCDAPLAHVALVDQDRTVVGGHGEGPLGADQPVEESLCLVTLSEDGPVEIPDATRDGRLSSLPAVTSGAVGAYIGVPISSEGHVIGALCVVDRSPREWPASAVGSLTDVAAAVGHELAMQAALRDQRRAADRAARLRALRDSLIGTETAAAVAEIAVDHLTRLPGVKGAAFVPAPGSGDRDPAPGAMRGLAVDAAYSTPGVQECLQLHLPVHAPDLTEVMARFSALLPDLLVLGAPAVVAWPLPTARPAVIVLALEGGRRIGSSGEDVIGEMAGVLARSLARIELAGQDETVRAEMAFLMEASSQLDLGLDVEQTLARAARIAVPGLAGRCVVHLVDDGTLRPAAVAHVDARAEAEMWTEQQRATHPTAGSTAGFGLAERVLAGGRTEVGTVAGCWVLSVPLRAHGRLLGVVSLAQARPGLGGRPPRIPFVESLVSRIAVAIDNALLYQQRDEAARALARRLLPPSLPQLPDIELAARYHPADTALGIGGDFYDAVPRPDGSLAVVIGDVCGRGPQAAGITAIARHTLRVVLEDGASPSAALSRLNRTLRSSIPGYERLTTAVVISISVDGLHTEVTVCAAGHPLPVLIRAGEPPEEIGTVNPMLGAIGDPPFAETSIRLDAGDTVLIYTDGVTESRGPAGMLETDGLLLGLADSAGLPSGLLLDRISDLLARYRDRDDDDVAMVAVRLRGQPVL